MRWRIAGFTFCDQQQTLTSEQNSQQLEPMMVELLSYFCQNHDKIISKDQLVEDVWLGRVVSDNAVSKLITKLRKALNDDARKPQYIATFPKKGYKFISFVEPLIEPSTPDKQTDIEASAKKETTSTLKPQELAVTEKSATEHNAKSHFNIKWFSVALLLVIAVLVITVLVMVQQNDQQADIPVLSHAKAITSEAGNELFPAVSPDGKFVSYMSAKNDRMHLMIKNTADQQIIEINHEEGVGVGPATWSFDGKFIAYLVATPQRCQYFVRAVEGANFGEAKLIHNCPTGSYGKIAFTHDNNRLVYAESEGRQQSLRVV